MWIYWEPIRNFLFSWQSLAGAFLGAISPIIIILLTRKLSEQEKYSNNLLLTQKLLVDNINSVVTARDDIRQFIDTRLQKLIVDIQDRIKTGSYSFDLTFFPAINPDPISIEILGIHFRSNYINNKLVFIHRKSIDLETSIKEIRNQFSETTRIQRELSLALIALNNPQKLAQEYLNNVILFKKELEQTVLKNFDLYINMSRRALRAVQLYEALGQYGWEKKFTSKHNFILNRQQKKKMNAGIYEKIDSYINALIEQEISTPSPNTPQQ